MFEATISMVVDFCLLTRRQTKYFSFIQGYRATIGQVLRLLGTSSVKWFRHFHHRWEILSVITINPGIQCFLGIWLECLKPSKNIHFNLCARLIWGVHIQNSFSCCLSFREACSEFCVLFLLPVLDLVSCYFETKSCGFGSLCSSRLLRPQRATFKIRIRHSVLFGLSWFISRRLWVA